MPRTRIEKLWLGGAVAVGLLIAVIGYFFLVSPQRAKTTDVQAQVSSAQLQATTLQSRITSLTAEQKKAASFRKALAQARAALPTADDLAATPALLRSLQAIARQSSTSVSSLTVGDPAALTPPATEATSTDSSSAAPSSSSAAPTSTTAPASSLYSVAVTASVSGSTKQLTDFLDRLQHHQPRAVLISGVTIGGAATTGKGGDTMSLTMTAFVRPSAAAAAPTTGLPGTTATPTTTDTP
ncbi:hypothetical protein [Jatrophihabitans endophyticus]|uniref:hypothetical protein n=1 Tax=Jatrophihabitans endophyticus TaxID=1206085 RepID=UPI001A04446B|nr:hypothetical protein [Jatrophihabitans endophyticus]MBE7190223.1 hypothetical protein [Jatrophihabitans endophyticus]